MSPCTSQGRISPRVTSGAEGLGTNLVEKKEGVTFVTPGMDEVAPHPRSGKLLQGDSKSGLSEVQWNKPGVLARSPPPLRHRGVPP